MKRKIYKKLVSWKESKSRKPLILYGARQTGKTFILKQFAKNEFAGMHYLNFEERRDDLLRLFDTDLTSDKIVARIELLLNVSIDPAKDIFIFDEIQECPRALTSLKYFSETKRELAVCCAGSHLGIALTTDSFPVGQVDMLHMYPLCFEEFLMADNPALAKILAGFEHDDDSIDEFVHERLWEELKAYYITGGLPDVVVQYISLKENALRAFLAARDMQAKLITGYTSDFSKHSGKENAHHILRVFENVPVQLSRETDGSAKKFRFKDVIPGKSKFAELAGPIDWLVRCGLVCKTHITETPSLPLKAYIKENRFKLYLFDIGILGSMLELPFQAILDQNYGIYKGFFAENFVAQEFIAAGADPLYCWSQRNAEVEFLRVLDGKIVPVEVKSGKRTKSKSLAVYSQRYNPHMKIKISGLPYNKKESFINYPLYLAGKIQQFGTQ
jgi:predicted AAA+ superfamily ATPase